MSNFWDMVWLMISTFFFVAYLIVMFQIVVDLHDRDRQQLEGAVGDRPDLHPGADGHHLHHGARQGHGLAPAGQPAEGQVGDRGLLLHQESGRQVTAADIAEAKALLDAGTINQAEFDKLKAKVLA